MAIFTIRFREIQVNEVELEANSLKECYNLFMKNMLKQAVSSKSIVGFRCEIEYITQGTNHEQCCRRRKPDSKQNGKDKTINRRSTGDKRTFSNQKKRADKSSVKAIDSGVPVPLPKRTLHRSRDNASVSEVKLQ